MSLSEREVAVLYASFQCLKEPIQVDYEKLATVAGYKSDIAARNCFRQIKQKLSGENNDSSTVEAKTTISKDDDDNATPTPRKRRTKKAQTPAENKEAIGSDKEQPEPAPKKRGRPSKNKDNSGPRSKKNKQSPVEPTEDAEVATNSNPLL